jgi:hypothetical protein
MRIILNLFPTSSTNLKIHVLIITFFGDKIEKNEMGGACSVFGGEERCIQGFVEET